MTKRLACPECKEQGFDIAYDSPRGLGTHRRLRHGIPGSSPSVLSLRRKQAEKSNIYPCPECKAQGIEKIYTVASGLGLHRRIKHNVAGTSSAALSARRKQAEETEASEASAEVPTNVVVTNGKSKLKCFYCPRTFAGTRWRSKHIHLAHPGQATDELSIELQKGSPNGTIHESEEDKNKREFTIYHAGILEGIARGMANETNLPPKEFTSRCAEYLYSATRR